MHVAFRIFFSYFMLMPEDFIISIIDDWASKNMGEEERAMMRQLRQMAGKRIADAFKAYYAAGKDVSKMANTKQESMVERILKGSQKVSDAWKAWRDNCRDLDELTLAQYVIVAPVAEAWDAWRDADENVLKMTDAKQIRIVEGSLKGGHMVSYAWKAWRDNCRDLNELTLA